jgi:hypothetical protein
MSELDSQESSTIDDFWDKNKDEEDETAEDLSQQIQGLISGGAESKFDGTLKQLEKIESKLTQGYKETEFLLLDIEEKAKDGIYVVNELKTGNYEKFQLYLAKVLGEKNFEEAIEKIKKRRSSELDKSLVDLVAENTRERYRKQGQYLASAIAEADENLRGAQDTYLDRVRAVGLIEKYKPKAEAEMAKLKAKLDEMQAYIERCHSNPEESRHIGSITQEMFRLKAEASNKVVEYEMNTMPLPQIEVQLKRCEHSISNIERYKRSYQEKAININSAIINIGLTMKEAPFSSLRNFIDVVDGYNNAMKEGSIIEEQLGKRNSLLIKAYDAVTAKGNEVQPRDFGNVEPGPKLNPFEIFEKAKIKTDEYLGRIRQRSR